MHGKVMLWYRPTHICIYDLLHVPKISKAVACHRPRVGRLREISMVKDIIDFLPGCRRDINTGRMIRPQLRVQVGVTSGVEVPHVICELSLLRNVDVSDHIQAPSSVERSRRGERNRTRSEEHTSEL